MKHYLLLIVLLFLSETFAQRIDENKVTFNYIQLPTNPIDKQFTTYKITIEPKYEKANEDSLMAYQSNLEAATAQYEAELNAWREQKKVIERENLAALANWEKTNNANGAISGRPVEKTPPPPPVMKEVEMAVMHSDINHELVNNKISLEGYDKGEGGSVVTVGIMPVSDINISFKKSGEGEKTKYNFTSTYKLPVEIKVESPTQGVVLQTIVGNTIKNYSIDSYYSQYEFKLWWLDNKQQFYQKLEKYARNQIMSEVNNVLNMKCGFPIKKRITDVYTVKSFKDHTYNDLTNAYTLASQGYSRLSQKRDRSSAHEKLNGAIQIWKKMLEESDMNDRKARVNDKVTALLYCNIAEAYIWMSEFDKSEQYINQALNAGKVKFKWAAQRLQSLLKERKLRWKSNY